MSARIFLAHLSYSEVLKILFSSLIAEQNQNSPASLISWSRCKVGHLWRNKMIELSDWFQLLEIASSDAVVCRQLIDFINLFYHFFFIIFDRENLTFSNQTRNRNYQISENLRACQKITGNGHPVLENSVALVNTQVIISAHSRTPSHVCFPLYSPRCVQKEAFQNNPTIEIFFWKSIFGGNLALDKRLRLAPIQIQNSRNPAAKARIAFYALADFFWRREFGFKN